MHLSTMQAFKTIIKQHVTTPFLYAFWVCILKHCLNAQFSMITTTLWVCIGIPTTIENHPCFHRFYCSFSTRINSNTTRLLSRCSTQHISYRRHNNSWGNASDTYI